MKKQFVILLAGVVLLAPAVAQAVQFAVVGPRALGMGGASVAAVNDSSAVYWNPAALADFRKVDIRIEGSAALHDHIGLKDTWDRIDDLYDLALTGDPATLTQLRQLILGLDKPDMTTDIDASAGLLISIPVGKSAIAVSGLAVAYGEIYPVVDTLNIDVTPFAGPPPAGSVALNNTAATGVAIAAVESTLSLATSLGNTVFIGANAKMISARTFLHSDYLQNGDFNNFYEDINNTKTTTNKGSIDAGILIKPVKSFGIGVVGRYLNSPKFPIKGSIAEQQITGDVAVSPSEGELELKPQYRAGIAWKPVRLLTLSVDYDLSKNRTFTKTYEYQTLAGGVELTLPKEIVSFRAGAYKNMADSDANVTYTAGFGFRIFAFRFDVAGAYDFDERAYQASANLALRF